MTTVTVTVQRLIGRMSITDTGRGKVYPAGPGFEFRPDAEHLKHRETYTYEQARQVADWMNGIDQPLPLIARSVDPFDPSLRALKRARGFEPRRGLTPLPDKP